MCNKYESRNERDTPFTDTSRKDNYSITPIYIRESRYKILLMIGVDAISVMQSRLFRESALF